MINSSLPSVQQEQKSLPAHMLNSAPSKPIYALQKTGMLYKQGEHFKRWIKRFLQCEKNFMKIAHDTQGKNMKIYDLNDYTLLWLGKVREKYAFTFRLRAGLKRKVKEIVLASTDELTAKDWFKFFLSVVDTAVPALGIAIASDPITRGRGRSLSQDKGIETVVQTVEAVAATEPAEEFPDIVVMSKRRSISVGGKIKEIADAACKAAEESMDESSFSALDSSSQDFGADTLGTSVFTMKETKEPSVDPVVQERISLISNPTLVDKLEKLNQTSPAVMVKPKPAEFSLPGDAPRWVEEVFDKYVKNNKIWTNMKNDKVDLEAWNVIQDNKNLKIMQSYKKTNVFRCLYAMDGSTSPEKLLQVLLDAQNRGKWDNSFGKAALLSYMPSTKQCVIHQVNKPFGMFYFPREFVYSRYVCKTLDTFFIIDKSVDETPVEKSLRCPRGEIDYYIMHISKEGGQVYLNILLSMTNGGLVSSAQDTQITLHSLTNFANLPSIFDQYEQWDDFELAFMPSSDGGDDDDIVPARRESIAMDMRKTVYRVKQKEENQEVQDSTFAPIPEQSTEEVLKVQNPLECSNIVAVLERESVMSKFPEESKLEEELIALMTPASKRDTLPPKPEPSPIVEETLFTLLDKVNKQLPGTECVDKNLAKRNLTNEEMSTVIPEADNEIINGKTWKRDPASGLRFIDEEFLNKQKKVLGHFLRSMGKNFLEGKSIMNVSLPVTIFSNESMLQRASSSFAYAPILLPIAGQQTDPLEAFKYVVAFYFSTLHTAITQSKPFNPILGETYQGYLNGIPISCEQISHHPPVSALFMKTKDFFLHGNQQLDASLGPNSATASHKRRLCITLPKLGMHVYAYFPVAVVSGTTFGKRYFNWSKKLKVYDTKNNLYCELLFNPDEKGVISNLFSKKTIDADRAKGAIYKVKKEFLDVLHKKEDTINTDSRAKFNPKEHVIEELAPVEGSWINFMEVSGTRLWDGEKMKPFKLIDQPNKALASDSNFREDLIYMKIGDLTKAQEAKDKLENIQRADKKGREKLHKGKH